MKIRLFFLSVFLIIVFVEPILAWPDMPTPRLHVEGRFLKDTHGNTVNLHGFAQTYSPWFNERGQYWNNYDVEGCLTYNQGLIDDILDAGWKMNFLRLHMDPYWSNDPGCTPDGHELPNCFSETRFRKYLDEVFVPMAEYAISKGLYVVIRPPGVSPEVIGVEDDYNYDEYLMTVWDIVSSHPKILEMEEVMFELANEPVRIRLADGSVGNNTQAHFDVLKQIFQPVVDKIRENGFHNVLWIPGSAYQAQYKGYAVNPIEGENIGYAVHIYPGWFGSADGYEVFKQEWDANVKPVADFAPIMITEMDWAPEKYEDVSWGTGITGTAGGEGFGANFKRIMDETGNVSWLLFTSPHFLADFSAEEPADGETYTFLNDPEACPWPIYHWYQEYAQTDYPRPEFEYQSHSDNEDGTYTNPLIHADFPDPDVIRVDDVYYMVSTTMHIFPGATLLKSYDLVNWDYCNNPLEMIEAGDAYNLLNGEDRYARGQWASSLRYNDGTFYIMFNTLDEGAYLLTSSDPAGQWDLQKLSRSYYDPGLFFDEDGKTYVVHGINTIKITELDDNFEAIGEDRTVIERPESGLEGCHMYQINGFYYIYATYGGWPASQVAFRSTNLFGDYEEKLLLDDDNIHQGALVETQTGEWWTVLFYDKGPFGRFPNLQPVTWVNNWPEIGENGQGVTTYRKPDVGQSYPVTVLPTNDNFRNYQLGKQWGWNHNPDDSKWSLFDRPGFLRLETAGVTDGLLNARNTLTQRIFGYHSEATDSYGTIKLDASNMQEGDVAGLAVFQDPYAFIGVTVANGEKRIMTELDGVAQVGTEALAEEVVYLRAVANYGTGIAKFYYSTDNQTYQPMGDDLNMAFDLSVFTGNKFAIFNYATETIGGFVDVDWFTTEATFTEDLFYDNSFIGFTEEQLTLDQLYMDDQEIEMVLGATRTLRITALFRDGHTETVSSEVSIVNSNPEIADVVNGRVVAGKNGEANITATYEDKLGNQQSVSFTVVVSTFPLTNEGFNPSIWETGTFDESTGELITGQYGFGGWQYDNGLDLSGYKFLVVKLKKIPGGNASFRIFDESSYWSSPFSYDVQDETELVIDLNRMKKKVDGQLIPLDPSHIYIVGFWSLGGSPILIDEVFLSNSDQYDTSVQEVVFEELLPDDLVKVYAVTGRLLRSKVKRKNAVSGLVTGVYVIGNTEKGYGKVVVSDSY
ncbi:family 43 glycosylhydrolase [Marinilabilia salmonicolor]|uniref:Beta-xylosidase n=1 Tax=Marinilabilia salmonicolor TaxID=989 RepID=A0A368UX50_9BACT|nr:family 43 glycosylhydrolase [Marinilabilia salmonicolor]RCW33309.1 beta-xylosidase [Marinilabilia salmonicolor]